MLQITVTNQTQRRKISHSDGPLMFGRTANPEKQSFVIDDKFVSREQIVIEETPNSKVKVENVGRQAIMLQNGQKMNQGDSRVMPMPARMTVGQTKIEINAGVVAADEPESEQTMAPDASDDVGICCAGEGVSVSAWVRFPIANRNHGTGGIVQRATSACGKCAGLSGVHFDGFAL